MRKIRGLTLALSMVLILMTVSSPIIASPTDLEITPKDEFNPRIYIRTDKPILSEMTAEEQYLFLIDSGVEIPEIVTGDVADAMFISSVIAGTEMYPGYRAAVNYWVMLDFGDAIRDAVNAYYGREPLLTQYSYEEQLRILTNYGVDLSDVDLQSYESFIQLAISVAEEQNHEVIVSNPIGAELAPRILDAVSAYYEAHPLALESLAYVRLQNTTSSSLQDSTQFCVWDNSYVNYNCYAYSVNRTDAFYWPGKFSTKTDSSDFDLSASIYTMACDVVSDLKSSAFSQRCVRITTTRPNSLSSGEKCICIRKGSKDFHFMKMQSSSEWRHKPGGTLPLRYNYLPSVERIWNNECIAGAVYFAPTCEYDSSIYYIIYKSSHSYSDVWTGNHYHSGNRHFYEYAYRCACGETASTTWIDKPCIKGNCALPWSNIETQ